MQRAGGIFTLFYGGLLSLVYDAIDFRLIEGRLCQFLATVPRNVLKVCEARLFDWEPSTLSAVEFSSPSKFYYIKKLRRATKHNNGKRV